jgi:hypothetical protein
MSAVEFYVAQMASLKRGYPLFNPQPGYDTQFRPLPRARFGDVGYVVDGKFRRLFNIHLPPGHAEQASQLPEQFKLLPIQMEKCELCPFSPGVLRSVTARSTNVGGELDL